MVSLVQGVPGRKHQSQNNIYKGKQKTTNSKNYF